MPALSQADENRADRAPGLPPWAQPYKPGEGPEGPGGPPRRPVSGLALAAFGVALACLFVVIRARHGYGGTVYEFVPEGSAGALAVAALVRIGRSSGGLAGRSLAWAALALAAVLALLTYSSVLP